MLQRRILARLCLAISAAALFACEDEGDFYPADPTVTTLSSAAVAVAGSVEMVHVARRATWWAFTQGRGPGSTWTRHEYDVGSTPGWISATAPLGFGETYVNPISYGPDPNNKFITSYFRKAFFVERSTPIPS